MIWQIIFCLFLFHQSNAMFKNSANIKNFIPPPGAHPHEVIGVPDAVQYKFTNEKSFWELNEKAEQLGHVDSLGNVDVFNVKSGQFERIEGEGKPPQPVIIQESIFAGQKQTPGASRFANQPSRGSSTIIDQPQPNKSKEPGKSLFVSSAGGGASMFPKFKIKEQGQKPTVSMFHAPSKAKKTPVEGVDGAIQYKMPTGSFWETYSGQLGHRNRHGNEDVFDKKDGEMKRVKGRGKAVQPAISILNPAAGGWNKARSVLVQNQPNESVFVGVGPKLKGGEGHGIPGKTMLGIGQIVEGKGSRNAPSPYVAAGNGGKAASLFAQIPEGAMPVSDTKFITLKANSSIKISSQDLRMLMEAIGKFLQNHGLNIENEYSYETLQTKMQDKYRKEFIGILSKHQLTSETFNEIYNIFEKINNLPIKYKKPEKIKSMLACWTLAVIITNTFSMLAKMQAQMQGFEDMSNVQLEKAKLRCIEIDKNILNLRDIEKSTFDVLELARMQILGELVNNFGHEYIEHTGSKSIFFEKNTIKSVFL